MFKKNPWVYLSLALILILASFLRFYRLLDYLTFLGDQGRDLLVVKRILVDHIPTLLGPTASVGGFYAGPAYYYFLVPFMAIFNLNPLGSAVMAALIGLATVLVSFFFFKTLTNSSKFSLLGAFLIAIAPKFVEMARFSWNPNPLPLFTLLTLWFLLLAAKKSKPLFCLFSGISLGILIELHYLSLVLVPVVLVSTVFLFWKKRLLLALTFGFLGVVIGLLPQIAYELRHSFSNLNLVLEFATRGSTIAPKSLNIFVLYNDTTRILFDNLLNFQGFWPQFFFITSILGSAIFIFKKKLPRESVILVGVYFFLGLLTLALYRGQILWHYYGALYPLAILLLVLTGMALMTFGKLGKLLTIVYFFAFTILAMNHQFYISSPNNLVDQTKKISQMALDMANNQPFNFALITPGNSDHAYRYFMEVQGKPPVVIENEAIDPQRYSVTNQLVVVCEQKNCAPLGNPLWEVAGFGRAQIVDEKTGPAGIKVLKLVHYKGE